MALIFIFALEAFLKLYALRSTYLKSLWNIFDLCVVITSLIDFTLNFVLASDGKYHENI